MIAEGRNALTVEDPLYADLQLFLAREPLWGNELQAFAGDIPPLLYLFDDSAKDVNGPLTERHVLVRPQLTDRPPRALCD